MSSRRSILSLAARLERTSICRRSPLHEASPAIRRRTSELPPLLHSVQPRRFTTTPIRRRDQAQDPHTTTDPTSVSKPAPSKQASSSSPPKIYTYEDILALTESPDANRILIDVREPSELHNTGRIPNSLNIPLQTHPDFAFLPASEFESVFGFPRPTKEQEVIFYCKAGVRSRAAAELAVRGGLGAKVGDYRGSWGEWSARGGRSERAEE